MLGGVSTLVRGAVTSRATTPGWWRHAVAWAVGVSLVVVAALWASQGGFAQLSQDSGTALTAAGRATGLGAADLLLVQVGLMARIPWVERAYGQDQLARWHRWLGFGSFSLVCVHIVLITVGYAISNNTGLLAQAWDLVWNYPGLLLATAGTAALVLVVVTSVRAARRRLRYESWHLLHLYAYLGVGLALPHQVWAGTDFISSPWARGYWWTLYSAVAVSVLVFRVGIPLWRTLRHRLVVERVVTELPGVVSVHLSGRHLQELGARAGQFFQFRFLDGVGSSRGHPFSLSAAPSAQGLRITARDHGEGSARLATLRPGTRVLIEGPYGRLTDVVRTRQKVTFIGSGIGITPLRALLEELDYRPGEAVLVHRTGSTHDAVFAAETTELARRRGVRVHHLVGHRNHQRESWLPAGYPARSDSAALRTLVPDITEHDVYVCGPEQWMSAVRRAALEAGVTAAQIHLERFTY